MVKLNQRQEEEEKKQLKSRQLFTKKRGPNFCCLFIYNLNLMILVIRFQDILFILSIDT